MRVLVVEDQIDLAEDIVDGCGTKGSEPTSPTTVRRGSRRR